MRTRALTEAWPFAAIVAAGVAVFFVVRLLLPSGEDALPPPIRIAAEPPPPVYEVAVPAPPKPLVVAPGAAVVVVAEPVSRPVAAAPKPKPQPKPKARVAPKPKPQPAPAIQLTPAEPEPEPQPEPEPEPVRVLASVERPATKEKKTPPGHAKKAKKDKPQHEPPAVIEGVVVVPAVPTENPSPGREKHDKGLPPGQLKKD